MRCSSPVPQWPQLFIQCAATAAWGGCQGDEGADGAVRRRGRVLQTAAAAAMARPQHQRAARAHIVPGRPFAPFFAAPRRRRRVVRLLRPPATALATLATSLIDREGRPPAPRPDSPLFWYYSMSLTFFFFFFFFVSSGQAASMSSLMDSQPVATQPATYHAEDDDTDDEEEDDTPKAWGRLFPLTPDFDTVGA